jgi:hypothetical protein
MIDDLEEVAYFASTPSLFSLPLERFSRLFVCSDFLLETPEKSVKRSFSLVTRTFPFQRSQQLSQ